MSQSARRRSFALPSVWPRAAASSVAVILGVALAMATFSTEPAVAQDERLIGIWQKDYSRSDAPWPRRHDSPQPNAVDTEIDISLVGEDVVMNFTLRRRDWTTPVQVNANYITDNKPQQAPDFRGGMREVRAKWRKKKLTISYTVKIGEFEADVQEFWELSKNGSDLIQKVVGRGDNGRPDIRENYHVRATDIQ